MVNIMMISINYNNQILNLDNHNYFHNNKIREKIKQKQMQNVDY